MDERWAEVIAVVREGYESARTIAVEAGVTRADEDAAGPPAAAFGAMAAGMRLAAGDQSGGGPDAMRHDAEALRMLSELCRVEGLTWADVRGGAVS